jgi:hypothetical protein
MKRIFIVLTFLSLLLCVSCERDNTKALRENFQTLETCGICEEETMVLSIDMTKYQYWCNPSKGLYRFTDENGTQDLTLTLTGGEPSEDGGVDGVISGTLGQSGMKLTDLYILKKTSNMVWLWSDSDRCGIILPAWGTVNR